MSTSAHRRSLRAGAFLALVAGAGIVIGCQSQSGTGGSGANSAASDHPSRKSSGSDHPGSPARKSDHPGSPAAKGSEHPTSSVSNPKVASPAKPVAPNEICTLPPDADPNAVTKVQKGQSLDPVTLVDVRNGRKVSSADSKDKYLLVHYWVSW